MSSRSRQIAFQFAAAKLPGAIKAVFDGAPYNPTRIKLLQLLAIFHIADIEHLKQYARPIFGGRYLVALFGPLHIEIAAMLNGDPVWIAMAGLAIQRNWRLAGTQVQLADWPLDEQFQRYISTSDAAALKRAAVAFFEAPASARQNLFNIAAIAKARNGELWYDDFLDEQEISNIAAVSSDALMGLDPETLLA